MKQDVVQQMPLCFFWFIERKFRLVRSSCPLSLVVSLYLACPQELMYMGLPVLDIDQLDEYRMKYNGEMVSIQKVPAAGLDGSVDFRGFLAETR